MLHRLLDSRSKSGTGTQQRIEPEEFFPVDPKLILQSLGWTVDPVTDVGYFSFDKPLAAKCLTNEKKIMLLSTLPRPVQRFTLAHELAHVRLHLDTPEHGGGNLPRTLSMASGRKGPKPEKQIDIEREAEIFARELLMPAKAVRRQFRKLFGVDQLRAASGAVARLAPTASKKPPVSAHAAAYELAEYQTESAISLTRFFGVGVKAMGSRLVGLCLVY